MPDDVKPIEFLLLDYHLKRLDGRQAAAVQQAIEASPTLAAQSRNVGELLDLLEHDEIPSPPADLAERVMTRINVQSKVMPFAQAASAMPAGAAHDLSASPVLSLRELIAIAACITLFVGIFVPGYFKAQNMAYRSRCKNNLRQAWEGMAAYAQDHNDYLAYAGYVPGGSWLPTKTPDVRRVSTTKPLFMLLRGGYVKNPGVFICPATPHVRPMRAADYRDFSDFAEPANVSYSVQCLNLPQGRQLGKMDPMMVLLADRNPLFDSRSAHRLSPYEEDKANSAAHGDAAGQNVIYVTGHGGWFTSPTVGVEHDNIYRAGELLRHQGTEEPVSDTDTFVVP